MRNLTTEQAELVSCFSFSIVQKSNTDFTVTIQYKKKVVYRTTTSGIYDLWDWFELPVGGEVLFPTCKLGGMLDFNIYHSDTIGDSHEFKMLIYGFEDRDSLSYENEIFVSEIHIPIQQMQEKPFARFLEYINVMRLYKSEIWSATAHRIYIGDEKKNLNKILCQTFGSSKEQAIYRSKKKAGFKSCEIRHFERRLN